METERSSNALDLELIEILKQNIEDKQKLIDSLIEGGWSVKKQMAAEKDRQDKIVKMICKHLNKSVILVTCAWCNEPYNVKDGLGVIGVSSGICQECMQKLKGEMS